MQDTYEQIELDLLKNIASMFDIDEIDGGTLEWQIRKLDELGMLKAENIKTIAKYSKKTPTEINKMLKDAGYSNIEETAFKKAYEIGTLSTQPVALMKSEALKDILNSAVNNSIDGFNLVNTTALESATKEYIDIVNQVYLETAQGIYDYNTSIRKATNRLAEKGITGATYLRKDGTYIRRSLESAVRMQIMTSTNQCMTKMQEERAKEWGSNLVEVSSHIGARPSHAVWQGKIFMLEGSNEKYENFYTATGYGTVTGLAGVNCRHTFYPYLEGVSEKSYKHYNLTENKEQYDLEQEQRVLERKVRIEKKKMVVADQTGDVGMYEKASQKLRERQKDVKDFVDSHQTLRRDYTRESIGKYKSSEMEKVIKNNPISDTKVSEMPKNVSKMNKNDDKKVKYNKLTSVYTGNDTLIKGAFESATIDDSTRKIINNADKLDEVKVSTGVKRGGFSPVLNEIKVSNSKDYDTLYHEWGHSIDYLVSYKNAVDKNNFTWLSENIDKVRNETARAIKGSIPDNVISIFEKQYKRIQDTVKTNFIDNGILQESVVKRIIKEYGNNYTNASNYMQERIKNDIMKKELSRIYRKAVNEDTDYRKWACVSDIYDAITSGNAYKSNKLIASHGYDYYHKQSMFRLTRQGISHKENAEIFANYTEIKLGNYTEQLKFLQENCPELTTELEKTYKGLADILEGLK